MANSFQLIPSASAHEAYLLTPDSFHATLATPEMGELVPDFLPFAIGGIALTSLILALIIERLPITKKLIAAIQARLEPLRIVFWPVIGGILLVQALYNHPFGPEFTFASPLWRVIFGLGGLGLMVKRGRWVGALICLIALGGVEPKTPYLLSYLVYPFLFIAAAWPKVTSNQRLLLLRIGAGLGLLVAAITVKLLHPNLVNDLAQTYHLADSLGPWQPYFSWIAGWGEVILAICFIFGLATRGVALFLAGSFAAAQLFLPEPIWPHLIFYVGLAVLMIDGAGTYSLDHWLTVRLRGWIPSWSSKTSSATK